MSLCTFNLKVFVIIFLALYFSEIIPAILVYDVEIGLSVRLYR